ncbi:MAG: hypothetical protein ABJI18_09565 [Lentilitoribacter sp.]
MSFDPFAIAALLISLVSLGFSIEGRLRDRYKLKCFANMATTYGRGQETYEVEIEVTNVGRRSVSIVEIQFKDNEEDLGANLYAIWSPIYGGVVHKKPPVELAENQTKKFASGTLTREALLKKTKRIDVVVRDSRGRVYINTIGNDAYPGAEVEAAADALE